MSDQLDLFDASGDGLAKSRRRERSKPARHAEVSRFDTEGPLDGSGRPGSIPASPTNSPIPQPSDAAPTAGPSILVFPADRRIGKVRDVAAKLLARTTDRAVEHYRHQVTEGLVMNLTSKGVPAELHPEQVRLFWVAVECEINRQVYGRRPGNGGAA